MSRVSRSDLERMVARIGEHVDAPDLELDHYPAGGGYRVVSEGGSVTPFGERRRPAGEMFRTLYFTLGVLAYRNERI